MQWALFQLALAEGFTQKVPATVGGRYVCPR
jgi:hypothetical protein